jgi:hypothetical protein
MYPLRPREATINSDRPHNDFGHLPLDENADEDCGSVRVTRSSAKVRANGSGGKVLEGVS